MDTNNMTQPVFQFQKVMGADIQHLITHCLSAAVINVSLLLSDSHTLDSLLITLPLQINKTTNQISLHFYKPKEVFSMCRVMTTICLTDDQNITQGWTTQCRSYLLGIDFGSKYVASTLCNGVKNSTASQLDPFVQLNWLVCCQGALTRQRSWV